MAKRKTNVQFVRNGMEYSNFGALSQMFVMQAIEKYATACANAKPEQLDNGMINGHAWQGVAKEWLNNLNEHYDRPKVQTLAEMEKENPEGFRNPTH